MIEDYNRGLEFYDEIDYSIDSSFIASNIIYSGEDESLISTKIGIRCSITGINVILAAAGEATDVHERSYFIEDDSIYVCVGDSLFCIDSGSLKLKWNIKADESACYQIIALDNFLLIHGKFSITAINNEGKIIWSYLGKDKFITPDDTAEIEIINGNLKITDWELDEHLLDMSGNLILD